MQRSKAQNDRLHGLCRQAIQKCEALEHYEPWELKRYFAEELFGRGTLTRNLTAQQCSDLMQYIIAEFAMKGVELEVTAE